MMRHWIICDVHHMRHVLLGLLLVACHSSQALSFGLFDTDSTSEPGSVFLEVAEPYIEMHTGPGRGYPVFNVIEQGETIEVLKQKTNWYKVRSADNKTGWTKSAELAHTLKPSGVPVDLPEVNHGDYLKSSWRVGFNAGQVEGANTFSITAGYRPLSWIGTEIEWGKIFDNSVTSDYYGANLLLEPETDWTVAPFVTIGAGQFQFNNRQKVVVDDAGNSDYLSTGIGVNYYIGRNFVMRGEYRWYSVSTDDDRVGLNSWRLGLNTFF
jgi:opacity protein-like surface antigen